MFNRIRPLLGDFANIYTIGQMVGAFFGAASLAIIGQAIVKGFLGLSLVERIALAACLFVLLLLLILWCIKILRGRLAAKPSKQTANAADGGSGIIINTVNVGQTLDSSPTVDDSTVRRGSNHQESVAQVS